MRCTALPARALNFLAVCMSGSLKLAAAVPSRVRNSWSQACGGQVGRLLSIQALRLSIMAPVLSDVSAGGWATQALVIAAEAYVRAHLEAEKIDSSHDWWYVSVVGLRCAALQR